MKKGLVLALMCGYLLLGPSAIALSPTINEEAVDLTQFTPISTIISNETVQLDKHNPLQ